MTTRPNGAVTHRENDLLWAAHQREHTLLQQFVDKTEESLKLRLEGMNEVREQLRSQRSTFVTRDVYDANHEALRAEIAAVARVADDYETRKQYTTENTLSSRFQADLRRRDFALMLTIVGVAVAVFVDFFLR